MTPSARTHLPQQRRRGWASLLLLAVMLSAVSASPGRANGEDERWNPPGQLAAFTSAMRGGLICIPVKIRESTHLFLLDTGCSASCLDQSLVAKLSLATIRDDVVVSTIFQKITISTCEPPPIMMGGIHGDSLSEIGYLNLKAIRDESGVPFEGIIGMDILRQYVLHLDYDRGSVLICDQKKCGTPPGELIRGTLNQFGEIFLPMRISKQNHLFLVDTGINGSGSVGGELYDDYRSREFMRNVGTQLGMMDISGLRQHEPLGECRELWVGDTTMQGIMLTRSKKLAVGNRFLANYRVTLDFPGASIYLSPSRKFGLRDRSDYSGFFFPKSSTDWTISHVTTESVASDVGFLKGDRILKVNDTPASELTMHEKNRLLSTPTSEDQVFTIQRGDKTLKICIPGG